MLHAGNVEHLPQHSKPSCSSFCSTNCASRVGFKISHRVPNNVSTMLCQHLIDRDQSVFRGWACLSSAGRWAKMGLQDPAVIPVITLSFSAHVALCLTSAAHCVFLIWFKRMTCNQQSVYIHCTCAELLWSHARQDAALNHLFSLHRITV